MENSNVFLSFACIDKKVEQIRKILEDNGISCWSSQRDCRPGLPYASEIIAAIDNCGVFLVFITSNSVVSEDILNEIDYAHKIKRIIIPIFLEDINLSDEFGYYLSRKQRINLFDDNDESIDLLIKLIYANTQS